MTTSPPLYRCYSCPGLFATGEELVSHRFEHAHPDESFWEFYWRKWGHVWRGKVVVPERFSTLEVGR